MHVFPQKELSSTAIKSWLCDNLWSFQPEGVKWWLQSLISFRLLGKIELVWKVLQVAFIFSLTFDNTYKLDMVWLKDLSNAIFWMGSKCQETEPYYLWMWSRVFTHKFSFYGLLCEFSQSVGTCFADVDGRSGANLVWPDGKIISSIFGR